MSYKEEEDNQANSATSNNDVEKAEKKSNTKWSEFFNYKNPNFKRIVAGVFALIVIIVVIVICNQKNEEVNTYRVENVPLYTWFTTEKIEYENSELVFDRTNSATELKTGEGSQVVESTPFFFKDGKKVLFPQEMALVQPQFNEQERIPSLSILSGATAYPILSFAEYEESIGDAFLFDGVDLYFFINPATLVADDQEISLSAFSFVTYNYNHELYVYDYDKDTATYLENIKSATASSGKYKIDLATDTYEYDKTSHLLSKNIKKLEVLK